MTKSTLRLIGGLVASSVFIAGCGSDSGGGGQRGGMFAGTGEFADRFAITSVGAQGINDLVYPGPCVVDEIDVDEAFPEPVICTSFLLLAENGQFVLIDRDIGLIAGPPPFGGSFDEDSSDVDRMFIGQAVNRNLASDYDWELVSQSDTTLFGGGGIPNDENFGGGGAFDLNLFGERFGEADGEFIAEAFDTDPGADEGALLFWQNPNIDDDPAAAYALYGEPDYFPELPPGPVDGEMWYDIDYENGSSYEQIAGGYTYFPVLFNLSGFAASGYEQLPIISASVDGTGALSGLTEGIGACVLNGQLDPIDERYNAYSVFLQLDCDDGEEIQSVFEGLATVKLGVRDFYETPEDDTDDLTTRTLLIFASGGESEDGQLLGNYPTQSIWMTLIDLPVEEQLELLDELD